jgi:hypothetical protein
MLDTATAYNRFKFIGHEFLTWLWYLIEKNDAVLNHSDLPAMTLALGQRMVLENPRENHAETITIKGGYSNFETGFLPLKQGALVTEISLEAKSIETTWEFNLKGESLAVANMRISSLGPIENDEEIEAAVLEKVYLLEQIHTYIDILFEKFLNLRVSNQWRQEFIPQVQQWLRHN